MLACPVVTWDFNLEDETYQSKCDMESLQFIAAERKKRGMKKMGEKVENL